MDNIESIDLSGYSCHLDSQYGRGILLVERPGWLETDFQFADCSGSSLTTLKVGFFFLHVVPGKLMASVHVAFWQYKYL